MEDNCSTPQSGGAPHHGLAFVLAMGAPSGETVGDEELPPPQLPWSCSDCAQALQDFPGYFTSSSLLDSCALVFSAGRKGEGSPCPEEQDKSAPGGWCGSPHYNQRRVPPIHLLESLLFPLKSVYSWLLFPLSPRFPARHPPCPCPCPPPWSRVPSPWSRVPSPCFQGRGGPPSP